MKIKSKQGVTRSFRLPQELLDKLSMLAFRADRSLNNYVQRVLKEHTQTTTGRTQK